MRNITCLASLVATILSISMMDWRGYIIYASNTPQIDDKEWEKVES
jgi:hypothetical protein